MITLATFDVLDQELTRESAAFSLVADNLRWANTSVPFQLDPNYWTKYFTPIEPYLSHLQWTEFKYSEYPNLNQIIQSDDAGIYMFIVRPLKMINLLPQYVMYVGISGERDGKRPLKFRINEYFNIGHIRKRDMLHGMLKKYYHHTWIAYLELKNISADALRDLEKDFHGFFLPPCSLRDFPVSIKGIMKTAFRR